MPAVTIKVTIKVLNHLLLINDQASEHGFDCGDMPSVLERLTTCPQLPYCSLSLPTVIASSRCLHNAFTMFSLEVLCPWRFPIITGASQTSAELHSLPWSSLVFSGVLQSFPELLLVRRSSCYFLGAPFPRSSLCHELAFFAFFSPYFSQY